jgi:protein-tyrosine-phosphatase
MGMADQVDRTFETVFSDLVGEGDHASIKELFAYLVIFNMLERVSDQAKNLCEDTVFAVTGDTKSPKIYNILFLDETNSLTSKMAQAIGRMNFPNSGNYSSAGRAPAKTVSQGLIDFLKGRGVTLVDTKTHAIGDITFDELVDKQIIVTLDNPVSAYLEEVPFHTTVLEWDIGPIPQDDDTQSFESLYRELAVQISDLMILLRGHGAS